MKIDLDELIQWTVDNPIMTITSLIIIVLISGIKHWFVFWLGQQKERNK